MTYYKYCMTCQDKDGKNTGHIVYLTNPDTITALEFIESRTGLLTIGLIMVEEYHDIPPVQTPTTFILR